MSLSGFSILLFRAVSGLVCGVGRLFPLGAARHFALLDAASLFALLGAASVFAQIGAASVFGLLGASSLGGLLFASSLGGLLFAFFCPSSAPFGVAEF